MGWKYENVSLYESQKLAAKHELILKNKKISNKLYWTVYKIYYAGPTLDKVNLIILTNIKTIVAKLKKSNPEIQELVPNIITWELEAHSAFLQNL